ncbi:MAG: hypothetical protein ACFFF4_06850 [Candidatus Thorarchaeota archaeon]
MILIPNYGWITLLISGIIFYVYSNPKFKRITKTRNSMILILIATMIGLSIQVWFVHDINSLNSGSADLEYLSIDLGPNEVHQIANVPNWYSAAYLGWGISSDPNNVTFYLLEEHRPGERILETRLNRSYFYFRLPYRITNTLQTANWTICLENPSDNETTHFEAYMEWLEDNDILARFSVYLPYVLPLAVLVCMYLYIPVILFYQGENSFKQPLEKGGLIVLSMMLVGVYLYLANPLLVYLLLYQIPLFPVIITVSYFFIERRRWKQHLEDL